MPCRPGCSIATPIKRKTHDETNENTLKSSCSPRLGLSGCDDLQVYGSVGFSSYSGGGYYGGVGTSISIGGRIR